MPRKVAVLLAVIFVFAFSVLIAGSASASVAPGCTTDRPTFIGGPIYGYPDNRALDAHIGVTVGTNAGGSFVVLDPDGGPGDPVLAGYSWIDKINMTEPATGTTDPDAVKTWGQCVAANITLFYAEVYPKDPQDPDPAVPQKTNKVRYGSSAYYNGTATPGQNVSVLLRAPLIFAEGGNTGGLQGYVTYQGNAVPAAKISRVRAFPGDGAPCGVEGYSASPDSLLTATGPTRTYYKMDYLAGGQCGAASQAYSFQITCADVCGAVSKTFTKRVLVTIGKLPRVDVAFP